MKDHVAVCLPAIGNVHVISVMSSAKQFINTVKAPPGTQLEWAGLQHFKEVLFIEAVLERAVDKYDHSSMYSMR